MNTKVIGMYVRCSECYMKTSVEDVHSDKVRYFTPNGEMVRFMSGTTQDLINENLFLCECCEDERLEQDDY